MCMGSKTIAAPPPPKEEKPIFIRNPYLDEKENKQGISIRSDRASLTVPLETGIGFEGRGGSGVSSGGTRGGGTGTATGFVPARGSGSLTIGPSPNIEPEGSPAQPGNRLPGGSPGRTVEGQPGDNLLPNDPRRLPIDKRRRLIKR